MPDQQSATDKCDLLAIIDQTRRLVRASAQMLDQPKPDSFLGRKTQQPFPKQEN